MKQEPVTRPKVWPRVLRRLRVTLLVALYAIGISSAVFVTYWAFWLDSQNIDAPMLPTKLDGERAPFPPPFN